MNKFFTLLALILSGFVNAQTTLNISGQVTGGNYPALVVFFEPDVPNPPNIWSDTVSTDMAGFYTYSGTWPSSSGSILAYAVCSCIPALSSSYPYQAPSASLTIDFACPITTVGPCWATFDIGQVGILVPPYVVPFSAAIFANVSGGCGQFTYLWSWGDGTTSTEALPVHTYPGIGPYEICLTATDNSGCSTTYCDSVACDTTGILLPMGMQQPLTVEVIEMFVSTPEKAEVSNTMTVWPTPAERMLNVQLGTWGQGQVGLELLDLNGRLVQGWTRSMGAGRSTIILDLGSITPGYYTLVARDGSGSRLSRKVVVR